ncbi:MAG: 4Fe-4S dicluster domain-containing protein [Dysgonamonadaceae bacterium]|nr:4Fe-4S dicluster domain-containing protein [Dysgonamonadaceae bacterium]
MNVTVCISIGIVFLLWIFGNLYRRWKNRNKVIYVIESKCAGCRRCVQRCSHHVLETVEDETGIHAAVKYPGKCAACGNCLVKCKFNALKLVERS